MRNLNKKKSGSVVWMCCLISFCMCFTRSFMLVRNTNFFIVRSCVLECNCCCLILFNSHAQYFGCFRVTDVYCLFPWVLCVLSRWAVVVLRFNLVRHDASLSCILLFVSYMYCRVSCKSHMFLMGLLIWWWQNVVLLIAMVWFMVGSSFVFFSVVQFWFVTWPCGC